MILCADLHLRKTTPRARVDDYWAAQERKFRFTLEQAQTSPPLLVAGDFFHQPRPGEGLLRWVIDLLREYKVVPVVVPGQHDLPGHSLEQIGESGLGVLAAAGVIILLTDPVEVFYTNTDEVVWGTPYGQQPPNNKIEIEDFSPPRILLWHHMVIQEPLWPGQEADRAPAILRKYPQFDIICCGDNHTSFCYKTAPNESPANHWLINPGSMMRITAAQVDHRPRIFKYENGLVESILLPIEDNVLDLSELDAVKDKDSRIQAFVERLSMEWEAGLSFEKNIEKFFTENKTDPEVQKMVWRCLE